MEPYIIAASYIIADAYQAVLQPGYRTLHCYFRFILSFFRYHDVGLSSGLSCLLLDARGRQTYQLTALKFQPQLSQTQFVKIDEL